MRLRQLHLRQLSPARLQVTGETYAEAAQSLQLQWVQGYRGWDTRQNVYYTLGGQVCYHAAAVGICYDKEARTQRFITDDPESEGVAEGNTDDILCMARHPNKVVFATGEIGLRPKIIVWDADTMMQVTLRPHDSGTDKASGSLRNRQRRVELGKIEQEEQLH